MGSETILVSGHGAVRVLTLNRPERMNAWDTAMRSRLIGELEAAGRDPDVGAVVITGAGDRAFCAGQDLNEATGFDAARAEAWIDEFHALYRAVRKLEKPVIAAINGVAAGSAFQFALLCDIRIGHAGVRMGQPEINSGIASITGPWIMKEVLGLSRTIEMTLTGRLVEADEALRLGLLHHVVGSDEVMERALEVAGSLAAKPPLAMKLIKQRFFEVLEPGLADAVAAAKRYHRQSFEAGEPQQSTKAFLAKRGQNRNG